MLRKFIGRFSCTLCATICILSLSVPSFATEMPQVMDGDLRMENIRTAQCSVVVENGEVAATAKVTGSSEAEKCKIVLKIQEQQGSRWVTIGTCTVEENDYKANASNSIKAERGIAYRAQATVTVWVNGTSESKTVTTQGETA